MFLKAKDLLKLQYLIGYDCTVSVFCNFNKLGLRVSIINGITDQEYFYEELLIYAPNMHPHVVQNMLERFAYKAKNSIEQFLSIQN